LGPEIEAPSKTKVDPLIGRNVGSRYTITKKIGAGGMGVVYKAKQGAVDRDVAIKVLITRPTEDDEEYDTLVKRFHLEARAASRLSHPNTITIYDFGNDEGLLYIAMEFLKGVSLDEVLKAGKLTVQRTVRIVMQICHSLAEAHKNSIIHRDIKPDNIFLVNMGGSDDFVKVLDFGVAKIAGPSKDKTLTKAGMIFGTPKYMSPEQARCMPLDSRSDVYSVGILMYQMLMGSVPFDAEDHISILLMHCSEPAEIFCNRRPDLNIPPELEAVVFKAIMKDRDARYQSIDEMATVLDQIANKYQYVANTAILPVVSGYATSINQAVTPIPGSLTPPPTNISHTTNDFNLADTVGPDPTKLNLSSEGLPDSVGVVEVAAPEETPPPASGKVVVNDMPDLATEHAPATREKAKPPYLLIGVGMALVMGIVFAMTIVALMSSGDDEEGKEKPLVVAPDVGTSEPDPPETASTDAGQDAEATGATEEEDADPGEDAEEMAEADAQQKQGEEPEDDEVEITVNSKPKGAKVFIGTKKTSAGVTPLTFKQPRGDDEQVRVTLKLTGFEKMTKKIKLNEDSELDLVLKKRRTAPSKSKLEKEADDLFDNFKK
jgi:serine/threonine-protein kinase